MASKFSLGICLGQLGIIALTMGSQAALAQTAPAENQPVAEPQPVIVAQYFDGREDESLNDQPLPTIPQAFTSAYYNRRGNFFDNRQIWQSLSLILGIPDYPEQGISRDGRTVNKLYREVLEQQISGDPVLRTPDLPSPYTGSILTTPLVITEDAVEPARMFPPTSRPSYAEPAPSAPRPRNAPVPGLW